MEKVYKDSNDSEKLGNLFYKGTKNSGVDPGRIDAKLIEDVSVKFISDHAFERFKLKFRKIAREWCYDHDG